MALSRGAMVCLQFGIVVFSDHTHLLFLTLACEPFNIIFISLKNKPSCHTIPKVQTPSWWVKLFFESMNDVSKNHVGFA